MLMMKCAAHPDVTTNLRCGKCGRPICPKCLVQTPVGARCRDCARLEKLPTYSVSVGFYLRAVGTALGLAVVGGVSWWVVGTFLPFYWLNLLLAAGIGYVTGEVISIAVNRKRGTGLAVVAGVAVVLGYLVNILAPGGLPYGLFHIGVDLAAVVVGVYIAAGRLR